MADTCTRANQYTFHIKWIMLQKKYPGLDIEVDRGVAIWGWCHRSFGIPENLVSPHQIS